MWCPPPCTGKRFYPTVLHGEEASATICLFCKSTTRNVKTQHKCNNALLCCTPCCPFLTKPGWHLGSARITRTKFWLCWPTWKTNGCQDACLPSWLLQHLGQGLGSLSASKHCNFRSALGDLWSCHQKETFAVAVELFAIEKGSIHTLHVSFALLSIRCQLQLHKWTTWILHLFGVDSFVIKCPIRQIWGQSLFCAWSIWDNNWQMVKKLFWIVCELWIFLWCQCFAKETTVLSCKWAEHARQRGDTELNPNSKMTPALPHC